MQKSPTVMSNTKWASVVAKNFNICHKHKNNFIIERFDREKFQESQYPFSNLVH